MKPEPRWYRKAWQSASLSFFTICHQESDLLIGVPPAADTAKLRAFAAECLKECREPLEAYIAAHPSFVTTLLPYDLEAAAPSLVQTMCRAVRPAGVGPMAAVAGAVAEAVGRRLLSAFKLTALVVENGGDLFLAGNEPRRILVWAGKHPLSGRLSLRLSAGQLPCGLATSSGTIGHSLSFGKADTVTVLAADAAVADAYATAIANRVQRAADIAPALAWSERHPLVLGVLILADGQLGIRGALTLAGAED